MPPIQNRGVRRMLNALTYRATAHIARSHSHSMTRARTTHRRRYSDSAFTELTTLLIARQQLGAQQQQVRVRSRHAPHRAVRDTVPVCVPCCKRCCAVRALSTPAPSPRHRPTLSSAATHPHPYQKPHKPPPNPTLQQPPLRVYQHVGLQPPPSCSAKRPPKPPERFSSEGVDADTERWEWTNKATSEITVVALGQHAALLARAC